MVLIITTSSQLEDHGHLFIPSFPILERPTHFDAVNIILYLVSHDISLRIVRNIRFFNVYCPDFLRAVSLVLHYLSRGAHRHRWLSLLLRVVENILFLARLDVFET